MWVRGAAIRPVPRFAVVGAKTLEQIEVELGDDSARGRETLDAAFARFESTQPYLADAVSQLLSKPLDETALALGYFLSIAIWLSFEKTFGGVRLREVSPDAIEATGQAIELEEELRAAQGHSPFNLDDIVSVSQPNLLSFVHSHADAALDRSETEVDDVRAVYRAIVLLTLCLSHAVMPVDGALRGDVELIA